MTSMTAPPPVAEGASNASMDVDAGSNGAVVEQSRAPVDVISSQAIHENAVEVQRLLQHIIVEVGKSLRARTEMQVMLQEVRAQKSGSEARRAELRLAGKAEDGDDMKPTTGLTVDDQVFLRTYGARGAHDYIPNRKTIERACVQYNKKVRLLSEAIAQAKERLVAELPRAQAREEEEQRAATLAAARAAAEEQARLEELQRQQREEEEARQAKLAAEQAAAEAAAASGTSAPEANDSKPEAINIDDDDDDDKPLAGRTPAKPENSSENAGQDSSGNNASVDLTAESPDASAEASAPATSAPVPATATATAPSEAPPMDPAALLASLTGIPAATNASNLTQGKPSDTTSAPDSALPTGFENFDFPSLGLSNFGSMGPGDGGADGNNAGMDFGSSLYGGTGNDTNLDFGGSGAGGGTDGGNGMLDFNMDQFGDLDMSFLNNNVGESNDMS